MSDQCWPDISQHVHKFRWKPVLIFQLRPVDLEQRGRGLAGSPPRFLLLLKLKYSTKSKVIKVRLCSRTKFKASSGHTSKPHIQIMWSFLCKGTPQNTLQSLHTHTINLSYLLSCNAKNQFLLSSVSSTPAAATRRYNVVFCECTNLKVHDHIKITFFNSKKN